MPNEVEGIATMFQTASLDLPRLRREAASWGSSFDDTVQNIMLHGDEHVTNMIEVELAYHGTFYSTGESSFGIGSEYIQFSSVYDSECNPRFFINGL